LYSKPDYPSNNWNERQGCQSRCDGDPAECCCGEFEGGSFRSLQCEVFCFVLDGVLDLLFGDGWFETQTAIALRAPRTSLVFLVGVMVGVGRDFGLAFTAPS
jgi:hypothetical protein